MKTKQITTGLVFLTMLLTMTACGRFHEAVVAVGGGRDTDGALKRLDKVVERWEQEDQLRGYPRRRE